MPRSSRSASGPSCSAGPIATARAGRFPPIPLGGYVKFLGDSDATSATPSTSRCRPSRRKRAFFTQPLYARAAVVLGGPSANLLFAVLLLTGVFFVAGEPYSPTTVAVQADGPAAKAGLRTGDEIVRLAGKRINRYEDIQEAQFLYWAKPMPVEYRRGGKLLKGEIVPQVLRAHRQLQQHHALRRARHGPARPARGRRLHAQQPGRGGRPEGRRPAARRSTASRSTTSRTSRS